MSLFLLKIILLAIGLLIIAGLAYHAGKLLFQLKQQTIKQQQIRGERIASLTESIQVIAKAMQQQQCDISEGCIRIYHLLECMPVLPLPDYRSLYPAVYTLYDQVKDFDMLDARAKLTKQERRRQDKAREEIESQHESLVLKDCHRLAEFQAF